MPKATAVADLLATDDNLLAAQWNGLQQKLAERYGDDVSIEAILFLVGVQARGTGYSPELKKEDKQALIMDGTFHVMAAIGQYEAVVDPGEVEPRWVRKQALPALSRPEQEKLLQIGILRYFETQV